MFAGLLSGIIMMKYLNRTCNFFLIILCLTNSWTVAKAPLGAIEDLLDKHEKQDDFNGTVLIGENGKISYSRSIGFADFQNRIKLDESTSMPLSSITKTFTIMSIMILEERQLLDYNDRVKKYLRTIPYENITIQHLLTSTSGLKRLYDNAAGK